MSPNYPDGYPNNLNCTWTIESPSVNKFIVIEQFDTEEDHDFLYVSYICFL